jgi:hypothetical protein
MGVLGGENRVVSAIQRLSSPELVTGWFPRVIEELELMKIGSLSSDYADAAERLRELAGGAASFSPDDAKMLNFLALELIAGEDESTLAAGLGTWRTLAADDFSDVARKLAGASAAS